MHKYNITGDPGPQDGPGLDAVLIKLGTLCHIRMPAWVWLATAPVLAISLVGIGLFVPPEIVILIAGVIGQ